VQKKEVNKSTLELTPLSPSTSYRLISKRGALRHSNNSEECSGSPLVLSEHSQPHFARQYQ
jgi:hypothetical protein